MRILVDVNKHKEDGGEGKLTSGRPYNVLIRKGVELFEGGSHRPDGGAAFYYTIVDDNGVGVAVSESAVIEELG